MTTELYFYPKAFHKDNFLPAPIVKDFIQRKDWSNAYLLADHLRYVSGRDANFPAMEFAKACFEAQEFDWTTKFKRLLPHSYLWNSYIDDQTDIAENKKEYVTALKINSLFVLKFTKKTDCFSGSSDEPGNVDTYLKRQEKIFNELLNRGQLKGISHAITDMQEILKQNEVDFTLKQTFQLRMCTALVKKYVDDGVEKNYLKAIKVIKALQPSIEAQNLFMDICESTAKGGYTIIAKSCMMHVDVSLLDETGKQRFEEIRNLCKKSNKSEQV